MKKLARISVMLVLSLGLSGVPSVACELQGSCGYYTQGRGGLIEEWFENREKKQQTIKKSDSSSNKSQWYFLLGGAVGALDPNNYETVGPFQNEADCNEINTWAKKKGSSVSRCWRSSEK